MEKKFIVSTFVNPHLFWIMNMLENVERDKLTKKLEHLLKNNKLVCDLDTSFEVGELVALELNNSLYRGILEVNKEDDEGVQILKNSFMCWLLDYGTMVTTSRVYKLPAELRKIPPLALQVSLNHVAYAEQRLTYDETGQAAYVNDILTTPTGRSRKDALELLSKAKTVEFHLDQKEDGIHYGDISYKDEKGNKKSLKDELIKAGVLIENEKGFTEIKTSIHEYRDKNLPLISTMSRNSSFLVEQQEKYFPFLDTAQAKTSCLAYNDVTLKQLQKLNAEKSKIYGDLEDIDVNLTTMQRIRKPRIEEKRHSNLEMRQLLGRKEGFNKEIDKQDECSSSLKVEEKSESVNLKSNLGKENVFAALMQRLKNRGKSTNDLPYADISPCLLKELNLTEIYNTSKSAEHNSNISRHSVSSDDSFNVEKRNLLSSSKMEIVDSDDCRVSGIDMTCSTTSDDCAERKKEIKLESTPSEDDGKKTTAMEKVNTKVTKPNLIQRKIVIIPAGAESSLMQSRKKNTTRSSYSEKQPVKKPRMKSSGQQESDSSDKVLSRNTSSEHISENSHQHVPHSNIKPNCSCTQCDIWTHESVPKIREKSCAPDDILEPDPKNFLFKSQTEHFDSKVNIVSLNYSSMTTIEKQTETKLLVHSQSIPKPAKMLSNVNFHPDIRKSLMQEDYRVAKRIQIYSWPALLRNQHTFLIHGPGTGKTIAYLPVICSFLFEKSERYNLTKSGGPLAVILCSNSKKCHEIYILTKMLIGQSKITGNNKLKLCLVLPPITHINATNIDLLITTPTVIIDLLKNRVINFKRLCHLILEDGEKILKRDNLAMDKILNLTQNMLMNRVESKSVQLVVCGEHWSSRLENLLCSLQKTPMVCIGNYLEAALYGGINFSMKFNNSACKEQELRGLLKDTYKIHKSIIICKNDEIEEVKTILMLKGIDSMVITDDLSREDILYLEESWTKLKAGNYSVLVCTDFVLLSYLNITCASVLIHYSLPASWSKFVKRFSCLLESFRSPLQEVKKPVCQSVVLVDEMCEAQLKKFFNYINSTGLHKQLPEALKKYSESLKEQEEEKKVNDQIALCSTLKLFGKCIDFNCSQRHIISKSLDVLKEVPKNGKIKFKIIESHDVTSFSLRLLEYIDNENNVHVCSKIVDITEEVTDTLRITRKIIKPCLGQHCVYCDIEAVEDIYYRCQVVDMENETIRVYLIDKGNYVSTVKSRLYRLPKEFSLTAKPPAVLEGYMANFIPPYSDENFSNKAYFNLTSLLERHDYANKVFIADVCLQLGCTLWLEDIYEEVHLSDRIVPGFQLSREVLQLKLVDASKQQLSRLYQLCETANIPVTKVDKVAKKQIEQQQVTPQWAFLEMGNINEVIFCAAVSPEEFYIRHYKYSDLLYVLQKDIQEAIKKPNYPQLNCVQPGTICLAKDSLELEYCRVMVMKTENDKALCFFVDFGDEIIVPINELLYILEYFIKKLPFQSIQCKLHGLNPILDEWDPNVVNILYDYSVEPQTDIFRSLYVKVLAKDKAVFPCQTKYSILIKDGFGEKNALINQLLIDCGLALSSSETIEDFELPKLNNEAVNSSDEEINDENEYGTFRQNDGYCNDEEEEMLEFFVDNISDFINEFIFVPQKKPEEKKIIHHELPAITAVPAVDYYTPDVHWFQTETTVRLSIKLVDVTEIHVALTKGRIFNFSCMKDDRQYLLKLMLYEKIATMQYTQGGTDIRITLTKAKIIDWPRVVLSKQKTRNIHYDFERLDVSEEKHKKILQMPKELDDTDSDSEVDMMYMECSDLDSDFDADVPQDSD